MAEVYPQMNADDLQERLPAKPPPSQGEEQKRGLASTMSNSKSLSEQGTSPVFFRPHSEDKRYAFAPDCRRNVQPAVVRHQ